MSALLERTSLDPLPADDEVEKRVPEVVPATPESPVGFSPEANISLAALYGRFDDLVKIDQRGRAHRDDYKFLSKHELEQIAIHQDQIREGLVARRSQLLAQERRQKLRGIYGANYRARYGDSVELVTAQPAPAEYEYIGRHRAELSSVEAEVPLTYVQRIALAGIERQHELASTPKALSPRLARRMRDTWRWWVDDVAPSDKAIAGVVVAGVAVSMVLFLPDRTPADNESYGAPVPPIATTAPSISEMPQGTHHHRQAPVTTIKPTDIRIPSSLMLQRRPAGDSIWHEVEMLRLNDHALTPAQTAEVTAQVMQDNHIHSEEQARHLPVGFKAHLSQKARSLLRAFSKLHKSNT